MSRRNDPQDEDFNYGSKRSSSLGAFLREMPDRVDYIHQNQEETDVSVKRQRDFYCEVCSVACTSDPTFQTHLNGKQHKKKLKNLEMMNPDVAAAIGGSGQKRPADGVQDPNESMKIARTQKLTLKERLLQTLEPCVALHYIEELMPSIPRGEEPHYVCNLCCVTVPGITMYTHVIGFKHREKYLAMRYKESGLDKPEIASRSQEIENAEGKRVDVIRTIYSDAKYPWPPNKAPWSIEMGGDGIAPEESKSHFYNNAAVRVNDLPPDVAAMAAAPGGHPSNSHRRGVPQPPRLGLQQQQDEMMFSRRDMESLSDNPISHLLSGLSKCSVKNQNDAILAHKVACSLVSRLVDYKRSFVREPFLDTLNHDAHDIHGKLDMILAIGTRDNHRPAPRDDRVRPDHHNNRDPQQQQAFEADRRVRTGHHNNREPQQSGGLDAKRWVQRSCAPVTYPLPTSDGGGNGQRPPPSMQVPPPIGQNMQVPPPPVPRPAKPDKKGQKPVGPAQPSSDLPPPIAISMD